MGFCSFAVFLSVVPVVLTISPQQPQNIQAVLVSPSMTSMPTLTSVSVPLSATTTLLPDANSATLPVESLTTYTFTPFPTPTQQPVPGIFEETDPSNPPPVGSSLIPDFNLAWASALAKAKAKITQWSLEQKINATTGVGWQVGLCVANTPPIPFDGSDFPGLCVEDSVVGVRYADFITAFPVGVNAAATWNRTLIRQRGLYIGQENVGKGVNVALGPVMNIVRVPQGGRNWEGFGADPYLSGEAAYETILGMQSAGVQACAKHFLNNEQESSVETLSANVDDRTEHEIYAHPFLRSVMAGVASIMCSYNLVNGTYVCENSPMLNGILKHEYGFQGFIMSEWAATHSTHSAADGLDMTMPGEPGPEGRKWFGEALAAYVLNGTIPEARIDDMATRVLAGWYLLKQDSPSYPTVNFNAFFPQDGATNDHVDVQEDHAALVREMGAASIVMLKNVNKTLPLTGKSKPRTILLAGSDAGPATIAPNGFEDQAGNEGILAMGWGSGTAWFPYLISPYEAIQRRAVKDHTSITWTFDDFGLARAKQLAMHKDAAIVFINSDSGEWYRAVDGNRGDRKNLTAWHGGDDLVLTVAAQNQNTIVVVHSVGPLIIEPWVDHPNVTAILWAGLAGQETGNALTDVLYGDRNPSGKLPYTIARQPSDYPAQLALASSDPEAIAQRNYVQSNYTEGLEVDYRHFDAKNIAPRFEFGFGLSYTTFGYSNLQIVKVPSDELDTDKIAAWEAGTAPPAEVGSSVALWLHRPAYVVTFDIKNTGDVYGGEVAQLYVNHPPSAGEPPSILKGFNDVAIQPGETETVMITLSRYDLSIWDIVQQGWVRPQGPIGVTIGASSRDERLHGNISQ